MRLLIDGDRSFASGVFRGVIRTMRTAGTSVLQIFEAFASTTDRRINVHFIQGSPDEGVLLLSTRQPAAAGTAIDVIVYDDANFATKGTILESVSHRESAQSPPPPEGESEGGAEGNGSGTVIIVVVDTGSTTVVTEGTTTPPVEEEEEGSSNSCGTSWEGRPAAP